MTQALCLANVALTTQQHPAIPPMHMQAVMHQGDAGRLESLVSRLDGMGKEISHYQKRRHDSINARNCSGFPGGNGFYSFGAKKRKAFFALFPLSKLHHLSPENKCT